MAMPQFSVRQRLSWRFSLVRCHATATFALEPARPELATNKGRNMQHIQAVQRNVSLPCLHNLRMRVYMPGHLRQHLLSRSQIHRETQM